MKIKTIRNDFKQAVKIVKNLGIKKVYLGKSRTLKFKIFKARLAIGVRFLAGQIRVRPRIHFSGKFILALAIAFVVTGNLASFLKAKEPEIKVNGQQILIADKIEPKKVEEPQISQAIITRRSPFLFSNPVEFGYLSQGFSSYHRAFDIATSLGAEVRSLGDGVVEFAGMVPDGKGIIVIVGHGEGIKSLYAHLGRTRVIPGDIVNTSVPVGNVGMTGRTTGPHVHLEIYDNNAQVNPGNLLPDDQLPSLPR